MSFPLDRRACFFSRRGQNPLMLPGSYDLGYTIFRQNASGERPSPHLNWLVTAKLARLNRQGSVSQALGWNRKHVASLGPHSTDSFRLPSPVEVGLYRLEIVFRNGARDRLGRFSEYIRVLRPTTPYSRLTLDKTSFLPSETVIARVPGHQFGDPPATGPDAGGLEPQRAAVEPLDELDARHRQQRAEQRRHE